MAALPSPRIQNETDLDGRQVNGIVRYVFRHLDLDGANVLVKVKHHSKRTYAYQGRFYSNPHASNGYIYDWRSGDWKYVAPNIPPDIDRLIVCRIAKPYVYPISNHVYRRKDSPGPWLIEDWQHSLVAITAHEAMHLRQYLTNPHGKRGRFNEVETEWAAKRIHDEWASTH